MVIFQDIVQGKVVAINNSTETVLKKAVYLTSEQKLSFWQWHMKK